MKKHAKRAFVVFLTIVLVIGMLPLTSMANPLSKADSIISAGRMSNKKATLKNDNGTEYAVNIYETPSKLLSVNLISNTSSYVKEFALELDPGNMQPLASGSKTDDEWDSSGGVKGTVTIYYDRQGSTYKITRATGTWVNYDPSGTTLSNRKYIIACYSNLDTEQFISASISTASFDRSTGFTKYADGGAAICAIGANSFVKISRPSGNSWQLITPCPIAGNLPNP